MEFFKKSLTIFYMNTKTTAYLIFIIAALFSACRGPVVKENENNVLATFTSSKPIEKPTTTIDAEPEANIMFQSTDCGNTWQDISQGLPENQQAEDFFAGESDVYLRVKNGMYHSKSNLTTPVWEEENVPDPRSTSIAFNHSGVVAYNYEGKVYRKIPVTGTWMPIYANFNKHWMRTIFETSDGTIFLGRDNRLYKSTDQGQSWKQLQNESLVMDIVESDGVLIGTSQKGIMRSTDKG